MQFASKLGLFSNFGQQKANNYPQLNAFKGGLTLSTT